MNKEKMPTNNNVEADDAEFYKKFGGQVIRDLNENLIVIKDYKDTEEARKLLEKMQKMVEKELNRIER